MKLTKKTVVFVSGITIVFVSNAVITSIYTPAAQAAEIINYNSDEPFYTLPSNSIVINGGFELDQNAIPDPVDNFLYINNPNITGWTKSNNPADEWITVISGRSHSGNQNLRGGGYENFGYISQNLNTIPGQQYELNYYLKTQDQAELVDNKFQTFLGGEKISEVTNLLDKPFDFTPPYDYTTYTQYAYKFLATSESTELKFGYRNPIGFFFLDDVSVKPVPEPLTLGGTAVAGLLGFWLKNKRKQATN
ncbi:PEP-CTERM sorting domain-containing protein [Nostoc sp. UHCC 0302]|uniref:PEP-CTERM sorting domain-containing protein n=1 Tax=Nostoc sp. UHCC 0302 TaxID=3134896 RepID=UPI00311CAE30